MEDLPLLDIGNPDQWLLMILLETDDGYHLIRKLYCVTEPARRVEGFGERFTTQAHSEVMQIELE